MLNLLSSFLSERQIFVVLMQVSRRTLSWDRYYFYCLSMTFLSIRHVTEYCCHIWAGALACHLSLLDGIQRRIANLVGHDLVSSLEPLSLRRSVASLSLFYRYYNGRCSKGLSLVVPPNRTFGRTTRFSAHSHPYTVSVPNTNTWRCSSSFFPRTALLWNSLPVSCFPATYNLCLNSNATSIVIFLLSDFLFSCPLSPFLALTLSGLPSEVQADCSLLPTILFQLITLSFSGLCHN